MLIPGIITFAEAQERERAMLESARGFTPEESHFLVWRTEKAIIVPRGMPGRENYGRAVAAMAERGFPVFERDTGGDLTPQSPGVVNYSLVHRLDGANASIAEAYRRLTEPVIEFLEAEFGVAAGVGAVPGAFCDGAYNITANRLKIGGTAQRWKLLGGEGAGRRVAVLSHVALLVDVDLPPEIDALNAFYEACGIARHIDVSRHVTLAELADSDCVEPLKVAESLSRCLETPCDA